MTAYDILSRGVQLEWHEAVALVRDVIERGALAERQAVPELEEIELLPTGRVDVHGGFHSDAPQQELAEMLRMMLGETTQPPELARVVAEPPGSVEALSEALGYFERPRRDAVLQGVYLRASGSSPLPDADALIASLRATASPSATRTEDTGEGETPAASRRRHLYLAAGVSAVVVILLVGFVFARNRGSAPSGANEPSTLSKVSDRVSGVTAKVGSAVVAIGERVGLSGSAPAPEPKVVETTPATPPPEAAAPKQRRSEPARPGPQPAPVTPAPPIQTEKPAPTGAAVAPPGPAAATVEERVVRASPAVDETVYTSDSPGILPPVAIRPQLPKDPPPGVRPESLTRIQLVIRPDGRVESVKMLGQPRDILDSMLLSAAKAWQFQPALKGGLPVKYKTTVAISINRPR